MPPDVEDDASELKEAGWRQGSVLSETLLRSILDNGYSLDVSVDGCVAVVISHDCDVTNESLRAEPFAEILMGSIVDSSDPNFVESKSPRKYHLQVEDPTTVIEFYASRLYRVRRNLLKGHEPDITIVLSKDNIKELASWIARRYTRHALPDEFNNRVGTASKKARDKLKRDLSLFSGIYVFLQDEELPPDVTYNIDLRGIMKKESYDRQNLRTKAENLLGNIAGTLDNCDGISVEEVAVRSEDEFTLNDLRSWKRWDFDDLSFRGRDFEDIQAV